ncbi:hypothetical protein CBL_05429 [Carabus blaptoides fortunei]
MYPNTYTVGLRVPNYHQLHVRSDNEGVPHSTILAADELRTDETSSVYTFMSGRGSTEKRMPPGALIARSVLAAQIDDVDLKISRVPSSTGMSVSALGCRIIGSRGAYPGSRVAAAP